MASTSEQVEATTRRPLWGLLVAQFLGAFNDNAFKMVVTLLGIAAATAMATEGVADLDPESLTQTATTKAFVLFTLPLMLFSLPAMALGDRVSKRSLILWTKALEVLLMGAGTLLLYQGAAPSVLLVMLAAMGAQSAFFAPAKYGILPEILPHQRLSEANGKLEMFSFLAIVLGTVAGGALLEWSEPREWLAGLALLLLSVAGLSAAFAVPPTPAAGAREPVSTTFRSAWAALVGDRALWLATMGSVVFWGLASLLGQDVLVYAKQVLRLPNSQSGLPYGVFAIGVGAGSLLAARLSRGKVETGLIPLGALALSVCTAWLGWAGPGLAGTLAAMGLLGVASGFVVVPLNALIQWRAPSARRGAVIALMNGLSFAGILAGSLLCELLSRLGCDSGQILLVAGLLTLVATVWAVWLLPVALLRLCLVLITATLYRLRVRGVRNVPTEGGALLVPNHVSFLDAMFLVVALDRPVRFVVDLYWYERPLLRPFLKALGVIPIGAAGGPKVVLHALREAGRHLDEGELVCIFAEGEISRTGTTQPFRRGITRLLKGRQAPVVPVHLDRVYGGLLSPEGGRTRWLPRRVPCPATVSFGQPMEPTATPAEVRTAVEGLGQSAFADRRRELAPLHVRVVRRVRRAPWRVQLADAAGKRQRRLGALAGAVVLARRLRQHMEPSERLGALLPPSLVGTWAAVAASLSGRVWVPLNYTLGSAALASMCRQAELRRVLTSRALLQRLDVELPSQVEAIFVEDLLQGVGFAERLGAMVRAQFMSIAMLERSCGAVRRPRLDDLATILFSSGSSGEPKGIMLSHYNQQANCESMSQVLPLGPSDAMLGVLPLFHSFGNLALWYALQNGARLLLHANPLDGAVIGDLVARERGTVMLATPTFLQIYMRRCEPGQMGSMRLVLTGAEKLTEELAAAFEDRFGIRPVQGYGCTECSPAVAVSTPGFRAAGFYQAGTRRGSVGRPLPGVQVRIVDPQTRAELPVGEAGLVLVSGPNVMMGYLSRDDLTREVMVDGYYVTGDIGRLDEDGFLYITDRLSRFSKIGGEMVPHGVVEEHLQAASGLGERAFAVCGLPCERKGERLAVLTTLDDDALGLVLEALAGGGLPALFVPRRDQFVQVAELPTLGTGKLDLRAVKDLCARGGG
jgi:acyl-[acyl-carrier-protein]-phospholipid O-acyltransferase/long-chain-fatty-acid--[acyl-carrier-protein] ligase